MKEIKGYEGKYTIDEDGNVYSLLSNKYKKPERDKDGYLRIELWNNGKRKVYFVHRLVAMTYLDNPDNLPVVNHKDGIKDNNNVNNLEWCTQEYNINYYFKNFYSKPITVETDEYLIQMSIRKK